MTFVINFYGEGNVVSSYVKTLFLANIPTEIISIRQIVVLCLEATFSKESKPDNLVCKIIYSEARIPVYSSVADPGGASGAYPSRVLILSF